MGAHDSARKRQGRKNGAHHNNAHGERESGRVELRGDSMRQRDRGRNKDQLQRCARQQNPRSASHDSEHQSFCEQLT